MFAPNKDVGKVEQTVEIKGDSHMNTTDRGKNITGDYNKAGGDVNKGNNFTTHRNIGVPANADQAECSVKVDVKGRIKKVPLPAGKHTLKDLKGEIANLKLFDNYEKAIYQQKDDDGDMVDLCDTETLKNGAKIQVTF